MGRLYLEMQVNGDYISSNVEFICGSRIPAGNTGMLSMKNKGIPTAGKLILKPGEADAARHFAELKQE
jgi:hypothetical protein